MKIRFVLLALFIGVFLSGCATSSAIKDDSKVIWKDTKVVSKDVWHGTKDVSKKAWNGTKKAVHNATE